MLWAGGGSGVIDVLRPSFQFSFTGVTFCAVHIGRGELLYGVFGQGLLVCGVLRRYFRYHLRIFGTLSANARLVILISRRREERVLRVVEDHCEQVGSVTITRAGPE